MNKSVFKSFPNVGANPVAAVEEGGGLFPPGYFARVAFAAGVCAFAALSGLGVLMLRWGVPVHPLDMVLGVFTLSVLSGGVIGAFWTVRAVERPIRKEERVWRQEFERAQAEVDDLRAKMAKPVETGGYTGLIALFVLAARHLTGEDTTKRGSGLDVKDHARAIVVARALGLVEGDKRGMRWVSDDPGVVLGRLLLVARVDPGRVWVKTPTGQMSVNLEVQ